MSSKAAAPPLTTAFATLDGPAAEAQAAEISPEQAKAERALVWRLDIFMLLIGALGYIMKNLDQSNISNAYVSGMKEDLNIQGNEYNYFTTMFNVGYLVMLYPSTIIVSYVGPAHWLPTCEVLWGIATCCLSQAKDYQAVYGLRALIGFFEGSAWPAWITLISVWYSPSEIALRMAIFNMGQQAGGMLSGAIQGALIALDGHLGYSGWQWAFIVNGVITIGIAVLAFFLLPGYPEKPNPLARWWLTDELLAVAKARNARLRKAPQQPITVTTFFRSVRFWHFWLFSLAWPFGLNTAPSSYFNLWLKWLKLPSGAKRYTTQQLNYFPIGGQAIGLVAQVSFALLSDRTGNRLGFLLLHATINIVSQITLIASSPSNLPAQFAGYYLNYFGAMATVILCSWAADILTAEPELKTIIFATGTVVSYLLSAFLPLATFPASQTPYYKIGSRLYLAFMIVATGMYFSIRWLQRRDERAARVAEEQGSEEPSRGGSLNEKEALEEKTEL